MSILCFQDKREVRKININIYREEKYIMYWIKMVALQEEHHPSGAYINIVFTTSLPVCVVHK
jgi:hypothetical protein